MSSSKTVPWPQREGIRFAPPTRVAFAGCWHAQSGTCATVLIHTGDFLYTYGTAELMLARSKTKS